MHTKRAALFIIRHGLDHRTKNIRVDLRPVKAANMDQVRARNPAEARNVRAARKQPAIHIRKDVRPTRDACCRALPGLGVHGAEQFGYHLMGVGAVLLAHPLDRAGELIGSGEYVGVFGKEAEDQPRHEVIHVWTAGGSAPVGIVLQQLDIKPVETAGRLDVKGTLADLFDGADTCKGQEEPEVIREFTVFTRDRRDIGRQVFSFKSLAIRCKNKLCLGLRGGGAGLQLSKRSCDFTLSAHFEVNVVGLKHAALVGLVGRSAAQTLDGRRFVAERLQKGERELLAIERQLGKR